MSRLVACALTCMASIACANASPADFRYRAEFIAPESESHYRLVVPAVVYAGVERRDLGDLRVLNAAGESVPYAFLPRAPVGQGPVQTRTAKMFPLYGQESKGLDGVKLDVLRGTGGTVIRLAAEPEGTAPGRKLLGYLVDASEFELSIEAMTLDWQTGAGFSGAARVEASDDLLRWSTVVDEAPVLMLEHSGERLERKRVELQARKAKFFRLSLSRVPEDLVLKGVELELRGERIEPAREWRRVTGAAVPGKRNEYVFDTGGRFPVDRLRLVLPQQNTVARAELLTRDRDDDRWRPAGAASVFRLQRNGASLTSPDARVVPNADRHWLVRVDERGGGLGAGELALEIGWLPHEMVFAARGAGPFVLAYGSKSAKPEALQIGAVVPDYREGKAIAARMATLGEVVGSARARPSLADPIGLWRALVDSGDGKKWALWIVLGAGVLAVAWMALRLLRQLSTGQTPPRGRGE